MFLLEKGETEELVAKVFDGDVRDPCRAQEVGGVGDRGRGYSGGP